MTPLGGEATSVRGSSDRPSDALATVIDNATELARAELRLAAAEAKAWLIRAGLGLALVWLALLLTQVFVFVLALSPLALSNHSGPRVAIMLAASLMPVLVVSALAARELRTLKRLQSGVYDEAKNEDNPQPH